MPTFGCCRRGSDGAHARQYSFSLHPQRAFLRFCPLLLGSGVPWGSSRQPSPTQCVVCAPGSPTPLYSPAMCSHSSMLFFERYAFLVPHGHRIRSFSAFHREPEEGLTCWLSA